MRSPLKIAAALLATMMLSASCAALGFASKCDGTQIIGIFEQVGDLVENANVQSSDVVIGTIQQIELDGWNARVTMCVEPSEQVPEDTKLVVRTTSLLGEKFVDIQPQTSGPPYLGDGDVLDTDQTSKATELEEIFAKLAGVLGTGNLEQINRFTTAQARILRDHSDELKEILADLHEFTDVLVDRKDEIAAGVDNLDSVAQTILGEDSVLRSFLSSFADSSKVLNDQKDELETLLVSLDKFTNVSVRLLDQTENGLDEQFNDLRPVLRTLVANSENLKDALQTLATFSQWFPETMPGDYLQLDVCQSAPDNFEQGTTCDQAIGNDDPDARSTSTSQDTGALEYILRQPLRGRS
ncbi:MAG: phospholipid/cholesterol/gamma-HCH transport system substrate-binding protein [Actinomycetota bacterium]|jgi:phospholipid/cholesterol/gamma-HCH transport system substrate-binding protein|nr:phospholipid/cholesterol/gamma-HCH transport system substrate-binding protein [Actinomycetota bacterium]